LHRHLRATCESGWDFSTRWFRDGLHKHTVQAAWMIPVDLNCLLLHTEEVLLQLAKEKQQPDKIYFYTARIAARKSAIEAYCWNNHHGFYFDYQFKNKGQASQFTLAATFPLFFSVATAEQAKRVAECPETKFLQQHGLTTTLTQSGQQWVRPNGWAPLQWIAYRGLKKYGHYRLAAEIRKRSMLANDQVFEATGKMMEKYDVTEAKVSARGGEYVNQTGFGWTTAFT
jgi:alpha,alpha-trehalase